MQKRNCWMLGVLICILPLLACTDSSPKESRMTPREIARLAEETKVPSKEALPTSHRIVKEIGAMELSEVGELLHVIRFDEKEYFERSGKDLDLRNFTIDVAVTRATHILIAMYLENPPPESEGVRMIRDTFSFTPILIIRALEVRVVARAIEEADTKRYDNAEKLLFLADDCEAAYEAAMRLKVASI